jgi:hypothetical protein
MAQFQNIQFAVNVNPANQTANIDVRGSLLLADGDVPGKFNLDCAVFGDDLVFDDLLHRFNRVILGGDFGTIFRFNVDKPLSALNEDKRGKDEIYAELVLSQNIDAANGIIQILKRAKTPVKQIDV